jgi:hypothetical protein
MGFNLEAPVNADTAAILRRWAQTPIFVIKMTIVNSSSS